MNFVKKCFIIISMLILIILFVTTINKTTNATIDPNMIIVTGKVTDKNNKNIANVEVSFIDTSTNTSSATAVTDLNGEYIVNISEGKYKVEFKYPKKYDTQKINIRKYELYDKNLELGVVYNSELEDKKIKYLDAKFTKDLYEFRLIKNVYSKEEDLEKQIHNLQLNSESEHAFHNLIYEEHKGVTVILSDKQESEIQEYIDNYLNGDYNSIICKPQESMLSILDKIYAKLGKSSKYVNIDTIESENDNSATSIEVELSSPSIIDATAKELKDMTTPDESGSTTFPPSSTSSSESYPDFISGQIKVGNKIHNQKVTVKLVNVNTGSVKKSTSTNNGKYFIAYPGKGRYRLEFEFENTNEFNGQYYEAESISSINCMVETNRTNINKYYTDINYQKEENLDKYTNNVPEKIKGKSASFYVPPITEYYNPNDNKIVKNVTLKERDKFSLTVEENVNKFKIILSNGQVFREYDLKSNPNNENYRIRLFNITMDTKLSYGAKLLVEYEIKVTNNSNIDCKGYTLINRFESLEFDKNQYLLSDTNTKNGNKWEEIDRTEVKSLTGNDNIDNKTTELITYLKLKDGGLGAKKKETHYVTLTRPLDAEDGSTIFNGMSELIEYKNNEGRRNYNNTNLTGDVMNGVIKASNYVTVGEEADTAFSEDIAILPPTGFDIKTLCLLMISSVICLIGFKYLISKKLYLNVKKSKLKRKWNKF